MTCYLRIPDLVSLWFFPWIVPTHPSESVVEPKIGTERIGQSRDQVQKNRAAAWGTHTRSCFPARCWRRRRRWRRFPNQKHPAAPVYHPSLEVKFRSRALAWWICRRAPRRNFSLWLGARTPLLWELATRDSAWCLRSRRLIECECAPGCVTLPFNYSIFATGSTTAWLDL